VVMDARQPEQNVQMRVVHSEGYQSRRTSIKRPWEDDVPVQSSWQGETLLPPIDAASFRRPSVANSLSKEYEGSLHSGYGPDLIPEATAKRAKYYLGHDYKTLSRENLDLNGRILQAKASCKSSRMLPTLLHNLIPVQ